MKVGSSVNNNLAGIDSTKTDRVDLKAKKDSKDVNTLTGDISSSAKVELSERAQEMKKIKEVALAGEEVNQEKVLKLQKLIDEGKYNPDPKDIADRLVDEHLIFS